MTRKPLEPYKPHFNHKASEGMKYVPLNDRLARYVNECCSGGSDRVLKQLRLETERRKPRISP